MSKGEERNVRWLLAGLATGLALAAMRRYLQLKQTTALSDQSRSKGIKGSYIPAGPWRLYIRSVGPADGPVVVLVHGLVISSRYMEPLALALAAKGYRVLAPDLPGYGESVSGSPLFALSIARQADALRHWLTTLGIARAMFVANSYGCQVLSMLAMTDPDVVERLVLQGPTVDPAARSLPRQVLRDLRNGRREQYRSSATIGRIDYVKTGPWRALTSMCRLIHDRIEDRLPAISQPCLVVRGTRDPVVPAAWARRACELLPRGHLLEIEGATHTMNYVYPLSFAEAIDDFLKGRLDQEKPGL